MTIFQGKIKVTVIYKTLAKRGYLWTPGSLFAEQKERKTIYEV